MFAMLAGVVSQMDAQQVNAPRPEMVCDALQVGHGVFLREDVFETADQAVRDVKPASQ
jgi:hypothetical protein